MQERFKSGIPYIIKYMGEKLRKYPTASSSLEMTPLRDDPVFENNGIRIEIGEDGERYVVRKDKKAKYRNAITIEDKGSGTVYNAVVEEHPGTGEEIYLFLGIRSSKEQKAEVPKEGMLKKEA